MYKKVIVFYSSVEFARLCLESFPQGLDVLFFKDRKLFLHHLSKENFCTAFVEISGESGGDGDGFLEEKFSEKNHSFFYCVHQMNHYVKRKYKGKNLIAFPLGLFHFTKENPHFFNFFSEQEEEVLKSNSFFNSQSSSRHVSLLRKQILTAAFCDFPVLIEGENGTGKTLAAGLIHKLSKRKDYPFQKENIASIARGLIESELFGHAKGAFTGAEYRRKGLFEAADKGTLFLDEIGELDIELQPKLLQVLQEKTIRKVGEEKSVKVDVRMIYATNQNLKKKIQEGKFREDLYYRINVCKIYMPSLRDRIEDLEGLCNQILEKNSGHRKIALSSGALKKLMTHNWPGNIRELENVLNRATIGNHSGIITPSMINFS